MGENLIRTKPMEPGKVQESRIISRQRMSNNPKVMNYFYAYNYVNYVKNYGSFV